MRKPSLREIREILEKNFSVIRERYNVRRIGIFGSYVRGEEGERSDVDILVDFEDDSNVSLLDLVDLETYLSDLLGVKVDLVDSGSLKGRIGEIIKREVIYI